MSTTTTTATTAAAAIDVLRMVVAEHGPITVVRVSAAPLRGKNYKYYGLVRYQLVISKSGDVVARALGRARSERRSRRLAEKDAAETGLPVIRSIGKISDGEAASVLACLF